ncbi:hypothetical protein CPB85DRAFT_1531043 [Mucidula mucida]|nr:hypothetical protein CPB85DRAFT_1531043 [Mucidula mucida]
MLHFPISSFFSRLLPVVRSSPLYVSLTPPIMVSTPTLIMSLKSFLAFAGELEHKDSMGNTEILKRGDLQ